MGKSEVFKSTIQKAVTHKLKVVDYVNTFFFYLKSNVDKHNYDEIRDRDYEHDEFYKLLEKIEMNKDTDVHYEFIRKIDLIELMETYFDVAVQANGDSEKFVELLTILKKQTNMSEDLFLILKNSVPLLCSEEIMMIPVESSNVESVGYDKKLKEAYIQFKGGTSYKYFDISIQEFEKLKDAPSVGEYLSEFIKPFKEYQKVK